MADVISEVTGFFYEWGKGKLKELTTLKQAGSNRQYFRAVTNNGSYIVTSNPNNIQENNAFIEFSKHFQAKQPNRVAARLMSRSDVKSAPADVP